jgi:hypothetical protein
VAGTRGPIGKRSDERVRRNTPESQGQLPVAQGEGHYEFVRPQPDEDWHPIARMLWDGLEDSGMSEFYQLSDWAAAVMLCENLSRELKPQFVGFQDRIHSGTQEMEHLPTKMTLPIKGGNLTAMLRLFATLGVTEGDRRRLQIELSREALADPEAAADASVVDARARFAAGGSS